MKVIILSITKYKENDGIILAMSEQGPISFLVRGILNPKGKYAVLNNYLTIADVTFSDKPTKYPYLSSFENVESPLIIDQDANYLGSLMLLEEACLKMLQEEDFKEAYPYLLDAVRMIKKDKNRWHILLIFLAKLLKITGYEMEADGCIECGSKKDIVTFSFDEGGFICRNCISSSIKKEFSAEQMLYLRQVFLAKDYQIDHKYCNEENGRYLLNKFFEFIYRNFNFEFKAKEMLK